METIDIIKLLLPFVIVFVLYIIIGIAGNMKSLNNIKSRTVGEGQHGNARFCIAREIKSTFKSVDYNVDTDDVHCIMLGASGIDKTAFFLYPNIELNLASKVSMLITDTKWDICRNYWAVARDCYVYNVNVIDLRNHTRSNGNNFLYLVNKYMDLYKTSSKLSHKSNAEKYAKIISKTIVNMVGISRNMVKMLISMTRQKVY